MKYKAAIFDMDGTVLNTLDDLRDAINYTMEQTGHRADYTNEIVRSFFGSGVEVAVLRALATEAGMQEADLEAIGTPGHETVDGIDPKEVQHLIEVYKPYYAAHCDDKTGPYPGISQLLKKLRENGVVCAVVSNKPDEAVQPLAADTFPGMFDYALGEKAPLARKPARDMTDYVLKQLGFTTEEAVYIGDSEIDMQTAANGGMDCISVDWGFRSRAFLEAHHASVIVSKAEEIAEIILA